ncbi:unnamed protein product [Amoebophrya sp. A25]|nr:unnamed protein product [Amoebophrya sp. A25]|eukprot:GSA25T00025467001.1
MSRPGSAMSRPGSALNTNSRPGSNTIPSALQPSQQHKQEAPQFDTRHDDPTTLFPPVASSDARKLYAELHSSYDENDFESDSEDGDNQHGDAEGTKIILDGNKPIVVKASSKGSSSQGSKGKAKASAITITKKEDLAEFLRASSDSESEKDENKNIMPRDHGGHHQRGIVTSSSCKTSKEVVVKKTTTSSSCKTSKELAASSSGKKQGPLQLVSKTNKATPGGDRSEDENSSYDDDFEPDAVMDDEDHHSNVEKPMLTGGKERNNKTDNKTSDSSSVTTVEARQDGGDETAVHVGEDKVVNRDSNQDQKEDPRKQLADPPSRADEDSGSDTETFLTKEIEPRPLAVQPTTAAEETSTINADTAKWTVSALLEDCGNIEDVVTSQVLSQLVKYDEQE